MVKPLLSRCRTLGIRNLAWSKLLKMVSSIFKASTASYKRKFRLTLPFQYMSVFLEVSEVQDLQKWDHVHLHLPSRRQEK